MTQFITVTMSLTERDVENTEKVSKLLHTRNKAEAVSAALGITSSLGEMIKAGKELVLRHKNGDLVKILIPGLDYDNH